MNVQDKINKLEKARDKLDDKITDLYQEMVMIETDRLGKKFQNKYIKFKNTDGSVFYLYVNKVMRVYSNQVQCQGVGFNILIRKSVSNCNDCVTIEYINHFKNDRYATLAIDKIKIVSEQEVKTKLAEAQNRIIELSNKYNEDFKNVR